MNNINHNSYGRDNRSNLELRNQKSEGFSHSDQSFIFTELSERLSALSHDALMVEYGLKEEDFE